MITPFDNSWQFVSVVPSETPSREIWTNGNNGPIIKTFREFIVTERRMVLVVETDSRMVGMNWETRTRTEGKVS